MLDKTKEEEFNKLNNKHSISVYLCRWTPGARSCVTWQVLKLNAEAETFREMTAGHFVW